MNVKKRTPIHRFYRTLCVLESWMSIDWPKWLSINSFNLLLSTLRQDLVSFERTCKVEEIQCTKFVIKFVFVETNQLFCSNSNVILTRQTYGHRSSRVAGSNCLALAFWFSVRIWILKCRGQSDLGLWMTSVLAKRTRLQSADIRRILRPNMFLKRKSALYGCILFTSTKVMHRPRSVFTLHIGIKNTYKICMPNSFFKKNKLLPLDVCFLQPFSRAGRRLAASRSRLNDYEQLRWFPQRRIQSNTL